MFQIKLSNRARKDLKKLDKRFLSKVSQSVDALAINPFLGEKMSGEYRGSYRIKIPPTRIIYSVDLENETISIKTVGHRGDVYKRGL